MAVFDPKNEEETGMGQRVIFLAAPVGMHGSTAYEEATDRIRGRFPDALQGGRLELDAGRWRGAKHWRETYEEVLADLGVTDLCILTAEDGSVGRGIYDMWRYLTRERGAAARLALFPNGEELEGFALRVIDPDNWTRYAVAVRRAGDPTGRPRKGAEGEPADHEAGF